MGAGQRPGGAPPIRKSDRAFPYCEHPTTDGAEPQPLGSQCLQLASTLTSHCSLLILPSVDPFAQFAMSTRSGRRIVSVRTLVCKHDSLC
jgi:hypothetical protein